MINFANRLMQSYFDLAYNRVYDFTTARLSSYQTLLNTCLDKLRLRNNDQVLCVGLGTGNEVLHILARNKNVNIVGVDYSYTALRKAEKKALSLGVRIDVAMMDARRLEFATASFDKAVCIHVMDFLEEGEAATYEILRVLKEGGEYVITYPSDKEGTKLGLNLLKGSVLHSNNSGTAFGAPLGLVALMLGGMVYLPLLLRPKRRSYSRLELEALLATLTTGDCQIEEYDVYQDFIVSGQKLKVEETSTCFPRTSISVA